MEEAFNAFVATLPRMGSYNMTILWQTFTAGVEYGRSQEETVPMRQEEQLRGTPESRTLLAALTYFRDQVLSTNPEEVASGEWLGIEGVNSLIRKLEQQ